MYSRRFLNRILKKLSSVQIESIHRHRYVRINKYFSTLAKQAEVRVAKSLNESHAVSRIFYREYVKNNLTESPIQKSREEATNSKTNKKIQNERETFDKKANALCLKWCDEQSNELSIGSNKETITITADKYDFCRVICFLADAPVAAKTSQANSSSSNAVALNTSSTKSKIQSSPTEKALLSSDKSSTSSEKAFVSSGKASLPSEISSSPSETSSSDSETSSPTNKSSAIVAAQKTSKAKSNFRETRVERLIDKLTDEEIEEICRTKCPCRRCEALPIKSSLNYPFSRSSTGSYSSFYSGDRESSDIPGFKKQRLSKIRKMRKMKNEGLNRSNRKMIPPANYLNRPQFSGKSVHPRREMTQEAPRIHLKSYYQRKIRSHKKLRIPAVVRSDMHPNQNNTRVNLGYVRIPQMSSNDPLNQSLQGLPSRMNSTSNVQKRIPLRVTSVPIDPTLHSTENNLPSNIQKDWNISKSNQMKLDNAASESTLVKKLVEQDKSDFRLTENRSVMVYGPGKLKLVTSQYPQISDDKVCAIPEATFIRTSSVTEAITSFMLTIDRYASEYFSSRLPAIRSVQYIIIKMEYVNLTDADARHYLTGKENPYSFGTAIAGRTGTGTVIEIGSDVHNVKPGDKVLIKPISCGRCLLCLSDRSSLCENVQSLRISPHNGTLSHYYVHSSKFVTKISNGTKPMNGNVSSTEMYLKNVATTATLSSAIRACQKAKVTAGDNVMVIDGGPLGTATALTAQSMGATSVCLADIRKSILEQALKLGIDRVFLIDPRSPCRNTAIKIWEQIGDYPRLIFDCTGSQLTNQIAICAAKTGGKAILMKNDGSESTVSIANAILRDVDIIISTIGNDESEHAAIQYLNAGRLLLNDDLYHHYDLSTVHEAFQHLLDPNRLKSHIIVECRMNSDAEKEKNDDDEIKQ